MAKLPAVLLAACAALLAIAVPLLAGDPDMLQDFCVADYKSLEGRTCALNFHAYSSPNLYIPFVSKRICGISLNINISSYKIYLDTSVSKKI
jgi:hypothetical protein